MTNTNMMNPTSSNLTITFSSAASVATRNFLSFHLFFLRHVQIFELFVAIFVFVAIHSRRQKKHQGLPVWPVLGMLPSLASALHTNMYEWISDVLRRQNGTFRFKGPSFSSLNCIVTSDPRNLEHLLKSKFSNFPKGPYFPPTTRQRKTASIEFHSAKFRQLTTESLLELVHVRLLPVLEDSIKNFVPIDLQDVLLRLTFDNVCMIAFGVDPGCLRQGLPQIPFAKASEDATEATVLRFVTPTCVWKALRYLNIGMERKLKISIEGVDGFAYDVIQSRKRELSSRCDEKQKRSDLLTVFMRLKDEKGEAFCTKFLRDICVNFILAGRDTSSVALSWFFWLLDENPEVEEKILEEICRIVGEREEIKRGEIDPSGVVFRPEEIKKMEYLQAAISEALRLYPSVPVDHKEIASAQINLIVEFSLYSLAPRWGLGDQCEPIRRTN
ncbi:hypothetical protein UlMin_017908 [Ulmus minor]